MKDILKRFLILGILLIILISASLIIQYSYLSNVNIENKEENVEKSRQIMGEEINNKLKLNSQVILSASEIFSTKLYLNINTKDYLERLLDINNSFNSIYYIDMNDNVTMSANWELPSDYKASEKDWYKKAIKEKKLIYSEPYIDTWTKKEIITIANPIYDEGNKLKGVMAGDIFIENIIDVVKSTEVNNMGVLFLFDGQGNIIDCPKCEKYTELNKIDRVSDEFLAEMKANIRGEKKVVVDNIEGYISYQPIKGIDWIIGNFASMEDYYKMDKQLWFIFLITLIIIIGIFGGFIFMQNIYFIKPSYLLKKI